MDGGVIEQAEIDLPDNQEQSLNESDAAPHKQLN
jgi:hypothetical protein